MYLLYTALAGGFYWAVFAFLRPHAALIALVVVGSSLLKDVFVDGLLLGGNPAWYRYVEHNPFNYVLAAALLARYDVSGSVLGLSFGDRLLLALAAADFLIDLGQDVLVELRRRP